MSAVKAAVGFAAQNLVLLVLRDEVLTPVKARRAALLLRLASRILELCQKGTGANLRELYYRELSYFHDQPELNRYVDLLCAGVGLTRSLLGINAAPKGLLRGPLTLRATGDKIAALSAADQTLLVTETFLSCGLQFEQGAIGVLIVEKETILEWLLSHDEIRSAWVAMTGRGFPDHISNRFASRIVAEAEGRGLRACYLGDWNPSGIQVFLCYNIRSLEWIGLRQHQLSHDPYTHLRLTERDEALLRGLLHTRAETMSHFGLLEEAQTMADRHIKAEMESAADKILQALTDRT